MIETWFDRDITQQDAQAFLQALSLQDKENAPLLAVMDGADGAPRLVLASQAFFSLFGVSDAPALADRLFHGVDPGARRLASLSRSLPLEGGTRLERLRFFLGPGSEIITFLCRRMMLRDRPVFIAAALGVRAALMPARAMTPSASNQAPEAAPHVMEPSRIAEPGPSFELNSSPEPRPPEPTLPPEPPARTEAAEGAEAMPSTPSAARRDSFDSVAPPRHDAASLQALLLARWPKTRTLRFLWQTDAEGVCTLVTPQLADVVGAGSGDVVGQNLLDMAPRLDPTGRLAANLGGRETWSGLDLQWPMASEAATVAVTAGAIPAFDPDKHFAGFRGFGVIHLDRVKDAPPDAEGSPRVANVVPFPTPVKGLSADDTVAFRQIGETLRQETPAPEEKTHAFEQTRAVEQDHAHSVELAHTGEPVAIDPEPAATIAPEHVIAPTMSEVAKIEPVKIEPVKIEPVKIEPAEIEPAETEPAETEPLAIDTAETAPAATGLHPSIDPPLFLTEPNASAPADDEAQAVKLHASALADDEPVAAAAPASLPDPTVRDVEIRRNGLTILDRLTLGLLVSRNNVPIFANRHLLDMLGFASEDALHEAGGMTHLFGGLPGNVTGSEAVGIRARNGAIQSVNARMQAIEWDGLPATLLTLRPQNEAAKPDIASAKPDLVSKLDLATKPDLVSKPDVATKPDPAIKTDVASAKPASPDGKRTHDDTRLRLTHEAHELRAILETATDGVAVLDDSFTVLSLNRSGEALFGCDRSAVIGKPFLTLFAPHNQSLAAEYCEGLKSNATKSLLNDGREILVRAHQGGTIPVFMTLGRLGPSIVAETETETPPAARFCALFRDLTHWKKVERELDQARKEAERASALKSDFLAKVGHEIRTPLNAIIGFAEVIMDERFGPIGNARYKDYLKDIHDSGTHVMSLVNDLLDLSKIEAGKMELNAVAIDANKIITECVGLMQPQASRERVIMRLSLATMLPLIRADERSLRQIVLNLLSNAVKFNEPGGQVIVATTLAENGQVLIRIRDTGPGMSDKDIETALEPFRQLSGGRPTARGTGLGLPLTKALVEANHASFSIRSKVEHGTLVEVAFPPAPVSA